MLAIFTRPGPCGFHKMIKLLSSVIAVHLFLLLGCVNGQYFQWAKKFESPGGITVNDFTTDLSGNSYLAGTSRPVAGKSAFFIVKINSSGNVQWKREYLPVNATIAAAQSVAVDQLGNCYVTGVVNGGGSVVFDSIHSTASPAFLVKYSSNGSVLRVKYAGNNFSQFHVITADSSGRVYLTNGVKTSKYNSNGNLNWSNTGYGGTDIGIDKSSRVYLLSSSTLVKLNAQGVLSWTRSHGGNSIAVDRSGNSFVASADSIFKYSTAGALVWSNKGLHGNGIAVDAAGKIYLALGNNIRKLDVNGTSLIWTRATQNAYCKFIATNNQNCFTGGEFDPLNETVITPFHFMRVGINDPGQETRAFATKINQVSPVPFQAGIYTPPIPGDRICSGVYFAVPFFVSLNASSSFNPGNQFRAHLVNPQTGFDLDIGRADSAFIPFSVPQSPDYRLRVVSTNPVVVGDLNSPQLLHARLSLKHLNASLSPSGNISVCNGSSVVLSGGHGPNNSEYYWYRNNTFVSGGLHDSDLTVSQSGLYHFYVYSDDMICQLKSPDANVGIVANPSPGISASGPLSFCNGDSVVLSTAFSAGLTYQWKKNNVNIPGANENTFTAKTSGNYKVRVTNQNGCTGMSPVRVVSVNCRQGNAVTPDIKIFPQPFSESFNLSLRNAGPCTVRISDPAGKVVKEFDFEEQEMKVSMKEFPAGIYMMEILHGTEIRKSVLIKQ